MTRYTRRLATVAPLLAGVAACSPDHVAATPEPPSRELVAEQRAAAQRLLANPPKVAAPVYYIDGRPYAPGKDDNGDEFAVIDPRRIASVRVIEGAEAEERAGRPVPNGLIWITTKDGGAKH